MWLCPSCGRENLGRFNACEEGCGNPRPKSVEFYLPEDSPIVTDPRLLAGANSGQDWYCDHCTGANPGAKGGHPLVACAHCAEPRTQADEAHPRSRASVSATLRTAQQASAAKRAQKNDASALRRAERIERATLTNGGSDRPVKRRLRAILAFGIGAILLAGIAALVVSMITPAQSVPGKIASLDWQRSIAVDRMTTSRKTGWDVPAGGREINRDWRYKTTRQIFVETRETGAVCGHEDLGNGYFEDIPCTEAVYRSEDVSDWFYTFEVDTLDQVRVARTSGTTPDVYWPNVRTGHHERIGMKSEAYRAQISRDDGQTDLRSFDFSTWRTLAPGQSVSVTLNSWGKTIGVKIGKDLE